MASIDRHRTGDRKKKGKEKNGTTGGRQKGNVKQGGRDGISPFSPGKEKHGRCSILFFFLSPALYSSYNSLCQVHDEQMALHDDGLRSSWSPGVFWAGSREELHKKKGMGLGKEGGGKGRQRGIGEGRKEKERERERENVVNTRKGKGISGEKG
ncbi:hypothetical protein GE21DRAFT_1089912 [Neurospora crassa]|nr:hypothetical protein GE21DRAFT_1089912 [Neurospora crassa]